MVDRKQPGIDDASKIQPEIQDCAKPNQKFMIVNQKSMRNQWFFENQAEIDDCWKLNLKSMIVRIPIIFRNPSMNNRTSTKNRWLIDRNTIRNRWLFKPQIKKEVCSKNNQKLKLSRTNGNQWLLGNHIKIDSRSKATKIYDALKIDKKSMIFR